jgi:hypothetical protein
MMACASLQLPHFLGKAPVGVSTLFFEEFTSD